MLLPVRHLQLKSLMPHRIFCGNVAKIITQTELQQMHAMKTGGLIKVAMLFGYFASSDNLADYQLLVKLTEQFGLLFQIVDDILDVTVDTQTLGKTANKDILQQKPDHLPFPAHQYDKRKG